MTRDATFQEGGESPVHLGAFDDDDLRVVSALVQDAVFPVAEISWRPKARQFALLLNRFRWEDADAARRRGRRFERVQSVLAFENVQRVASQGIDRGDKDLVLSLLSLRFEPGDDCSGNIELTLAGDGVIRLEVEALEAVLRDVTRPYLAPSNKEPEHPE